MASTYLLIYFFTYLLEGLGMEPRAWHMLGKFSTTQPPQTSVISLSGQMALIVGYF